jgi:hypothetical protein
MFLCGPGQVLLQFLICVLQVRIANVFVCLDFKSGLEINLIFCFSLLSVRPYHKGVTLPKRTPEKLLAANIIRYKIRKTCGKPACIVMISAAWEDRSVFYENGWRFLALLRQAQHRCSE